MPLARHMTALLHRSYSVACNYVAIRSNRLVFPLNEARRSAYSPPNQSPTLYTLEAGTLTTRPFLESTTVPPPPPSASKPMTVKSFPCTSGSSTPSTRTSESNSNGDSSVPSAALAVGADISLSGLQGADGGGFEALPLPAPPPLARTQLEYDGGCCRPPGNEEITAVS